MKKEEEKKIGKEKEISASFKRQQINKQNEQSKGHPKKNHMKCKQKPVLMHSEFCFEIQTKKQRKKCIHTRMRNRIANEQSMCMTKH